jgi:hypothetical protein
MKKLALVTLLLAAAMSGAHAQGSGAPAAAGQTVTPAGEASASSAVQAKHDRRAARKAARKAAKAAKAASS